MNTFRIVAVTALAGLIAAVGASARKTDPAPQEQTPQGHSDQQQSVMPPGMKMGPDEENQAQSDAMKAMGHMLMDSAHMRMTPPRPVLPGDIERADEIVATLRDSLQKYKDYRAALADGYRIFMPNLPKPMYHFTNNWNGFLEAITFDPARPTSLLYTKTAGGYELIGAMFTAPKTASLDQLNARVPLSVAHWHVHTNLCLPKRGIAGADWKRFGLTGSISTPEACTEAGGRFYPQIFGWMVHVYPFETSREKVFAH